MLSGTSVMNGATKVDWLDMFVLGDEPGRATVRGKTGSKIVTREDAIKVLERAACATDKQEIDALLLLPISLCAGPAERGARH